MPSPSSNPCSNCSCYCYSALTYLSENISDYSQQRQSHQQANFPYMAPTRSKFKINTPFNDPDREFWSVIYIVVILLLFSCLIMSMMFHVLKEESKEQHIDDVLETLRYRHQLSEYIKEQHRRISAKRQFASWHSAIGSVKRSVTLRKSLLSLRRNSSTPEPGSGCLNKLSTQAKSMPLMMKHSLPAIVVSGPDIPSDSRTHETPAFLSPNTPVGTRSASSGVIFTLTNYDQHESRRMSDNVENDSRRSSEDAYSDVDSCTPQISPAESVSSHNMEGTHRIVRKFDFDNLA